MLVIWSVFYLGHNFQLNAFLEPLTKQNMALTGHKFKARERKRERKGGRGKNGFIAGNKNTSEFFLWIPSRQIPSVGDSEFSL